MYIYYIPYSYYSKIVYVSYYKLIIVYSKFGFGEE